MHLPSPASADLRPEKINAIIDVMLDASKEVCADASINEVFSAYFTLIARAMVVAEELGANQAVLKGAIERLLLRLTPPSTTIH